LRKEARLDGFVGFDRCGYFGDGITFFVMLPPDPRRAGREPTLSLSPSRDKCHGDDVQRVALQPV